MLVIVNLSTQSKLFQYQKKSIQAYYFTQKRAFIYKTVDGVAKYKMFVERTIYSLTIIIQ